MDPILTTHEITKINLLTRITLILFGIFFTSVIFAITIKIFDTIGIWLGLIISTAIIFYTLKHKAPGSQLRIIAWSMLGTLIIGTILYFVGLNYVKNTWEGFQTK